MRDQGASRFEPAVGQPLPSWLRDWRGDGILPRIIPRQPMVLQETALPVIDLRGALAEVPFPAVLADNRLIAQLAFAHLRELGLP